MATPHHLQIYNPCHGGNDNVFHLFPMLVKELRLCIWEFAVQQQRLLEVDIVPPSEPDNTSPYSTKNALGKPISGRNYVATVRGFQLHSKLLRVNRESRSVALRFYRVHIPCYLRTSSEEDFRMSAAEGPRDKSVLYFNPEHDFLRVTAYHPAEISFVDFLHDLKAYDPKDVGLLNLALDANGMSYLSTLTSIAETQARDTFIESLSHLRQVIWVAQSRCGRAIMGFLQDFPSAGVRFNHSMPVKTIKPSFSLLGHDSRSIGPELQYVLTGSVDPREMRVRWQQLLRNWGIRPLQPVKERVLFAFEPRGEIHDRDTARIFLEEEEDSWLTGQQQWRNLIMMRDTGKVPVESPEELAKAVRPAFGFWLFPAEALGPLDNFVPQMKIVFDMRGFRPELALSDLY